MARPRVVFVHGAWYGGWCWNRVGRDLAERGFAVAAPDLPGRGGDGVDVGQVSLTDCVERLAGVVLSSPEPVVLVAHSLGGVTATAMTEANPDSVAAVVYVGAFLLRSGSAAVYVIRSDEASEVRQIRRLSADGRSSIVADELADEVLWTDCSPEDIAAARGRLVAESTGLARERVDWSADGFGRPPRFYVECTRDRVIGPAAQRRMWTETPCVQVHSLETGHAPFFATPDRLAEIVVSISGSVA
jgi:pimeloyl-ACP methyl ester carboxylesterase